LEGGKGDSMSIKEANEVVGGANDKEPTERGPLGKKPGETTLHWLHRMDREYPGSKIRLMRRNPETGEREEVK